MGMKEDVTEMKQDVKQLLTLTARQEEHLKATNGQIKFHTKLLWGSGGFSFSILMLLIRHIMTT